MGGSHENLEHSEHAQHAAHGGNRKIALLISLIALVLAFSEMLGKSAQTEALALNIKASDTWTFFQAKTVRQTAIRTAAEALDTQATGITDSVTKAAIEKQIVAWKSTIARYESDPAVKDGRKELRAQAEHYEHERDTVMARYHHYEVASAALQIGIVLASAAIIADVVILVWLAGGLAIVGLAFMAIGLWAPHAVHIV